MNHHEHWLSLILRIIALSYMIQSQQFSTLLPYPLCYFWSYFVTNSNFFFLLLLLLYFIKFYLIDHFSNFAMLSTEVTFIMPTTSNEPSRTLVESDTQNYRALIHDLVTTVFHLIALFSLLLSYFYTYLNYINIQY